MASRRYNPGVRETHIVPARYTDSDSDSDSVLSCTTCDVDIGALIF